MSNNVAAYTGAIANMAAIETEFQTSWADLDFNKHARRPNCYIKTDLAAGETLRLWVRSSRDDGAGNPVWSPSAGGIFTVPAKNTVAQDEWAEARLVIGEEWSGLVVWTSAASTVQIWTTDAV